MVGVCSLVRGGGAGRQEAPKEGAHESCWVVPSLQSWLRKMRHLSYLWSFSAADAKCVWISGEHFHLSLRGAGSSLTESARTSFLEFSFLLVCETEVIKVTGIIHSLNTALLACELLLFNCFMCLSAPVHQGKFATGRGFSGAGTGVECPEGNSHVPEQVFSTLHHDDAIEGGMFAHGPAEPISSYHKLNKEKDRCIPVNTQGINRVLGKWWKPDKGLIVPLRCSYGSDQEFSCPTDQVGDLQIYCRRLACPVKGVALNSFHAAVWDWILWECKC